MTYSPGRIICLSAETADLCARLGVWDRVAAVTAYADQTGLPPKPVVSGFSSGNVAAILAHQPDLILAFSDVQASLCGELIRAGATVFATNQRTLSEIAATMRMIASLVGRQETGEALAADFITAIQLLRSNRARRPRVYFEEWPEPPVFGIPWISELIEMAGGADIFADRCSAAARDRTVSDAEIKGADPEIIVASWCGKPVERSVIQSRLAGTTAVRNGKIFELPGHCILQPGWRLTEGFQQLRNIFDTVE